MFLKEPIVCRKTKYEVTNIGLKEPVKVALTSDWHVSRIVSDKQRQFMKQRLTEIKPDLIILQGDMFDTPDALGNADLVSKLKKSMKMCAKIAPTVMVIGNHDQIRPTHKPPVSHADYMRRIRENVVEEWRLLCRECGVKLLIDEWFEIKGLRVFGMFQGPEVFYIKPSEKGENISEMRRHIKELDREGVFKFKPKKAHWFATHAPINELCKMHELEGFNVFSFGHTHGGCLPVIIDRIVDACGGHGGIIAPFAKWFPSDYMRGCKKLQNGANFIANTGMVMTQDSAPKILHYINFLKSAEITEVIIK